MASVLDKVLAAQQASGTLVVQQEAAVPAMSGGLGSLDDLAESTIDVDLYLKASDAGLKIGSSDGYIEEFEAVIDINDCVLNKTLRYGKSPVTYVKTYNGYTTTDGKSWAQVSKEALATYGDDAKIYDSVDVVMTLTKAVTDSKKNTVQEGTRVGYGTAASAIKDFTSFYKECKKKGITNALVKVSYRVGKKQGYNNWGIPTYELLGAAED